MAKAPQLAAVVAALVLVLSAAGYGIARGITDTEPGSTRLNATTVLPSEDELAWAAKLCAIQTVQKDVAQRTHGDDPEGVRAYAEANEKAAADLQQSMPPETAKGYQEALLKLYRETARYSRERLAAGTLSTDFPKELYDSTASLVANLQEAYAALPRSVVAALNCK